MGNYQTEEKIRLKFGSIDEPENFWKGRSVIDIGCNEGLLLLPLREKGIGKYTGIDNSKSYINDACKRFPDEDFILGDLRNLQIKADIGISFSTLHIFDDEEFEKIIKRFSRLFRVLIIECPVLGTAPIYYTRTEQQITEIANRYFDYCWEYGVSPSPHDLQSVRKTFKMENYLEKEVNIENLYTYSFGDRDKLIDLHIVGCAKEIIDGKKDYTSTAHYKWCADWFDEHGNLFGREDREFIDIRAKQFYDLVKSVERGYIDRRDDEKLTNGRLYGDVLCRDEADGDIVVVDGHHRLSILYALGIKSAKVKLCI